jgi:predicted Zn-dependent protease
MSQYEIFKDVLNGVEYKVKKDDATNCLYLYKNDVYQENLFFGFIQAIKFMKYSCVFCTWTGEQSECVESKTACTACPVCGSECQPLFEV